MDAAGLVKRYQGAVALDGIDLQVRAGEIVGLLGRNGAGKTTLLECLLGLRTLDHGSVRIQNIDAGQNPAAARARVGAQLQGATLQDDLTPAEALALFASFYPQPADPSELLRRFALEEKSHARFGTLSAGQRQRLFLALAFVNRPVLLVLDEPTTGLDVASRRELHRQILAARDEGCAVLLSTHYGEEAAALCDRVAILDRGRILKVDTPAALRSGAGRTTVRIVARPMPDPGWFRALAGVSSVARSGPECVLETAQAAPVVAAVTRWIEAAGGELIDLRVQPPSLEDLVVELTGQPWEQAEEGDRA